MASTFNAFDLLNDKPSSAAGKKKKNKSKKKSDASASEPATAASIAPAPAAQAPAAVVEATTAVSKVAIEDGFRPAGRTGSKRANGHANGLAKPGKPDLKQTQSLSSAISAIQRDAAGAVGLRRGEAWGKWLEQLSSPELYESVPAGSKLTFREVLLASNGLELALQAALAQPLTAPECKQLLALLTAALPTLVDVCTEVVSVLADMSVALGSATPELLGLGQEAVASLATALKSAAVAKQDAANGDQSRQLAAVASKVAATGSKLGSATTAKDQSKLSATLLQAVEQQLALVQTGGMKTMEELLPADRFLAVLHARIHEGNLSGSKQSQLLEGLQQEESMLEQQAASLNAQISALESQLTTLKQQAADITSKLAQNQQRRKAIFQPIERGVNAQRKQAEEQQVMERLQGLLQAIKRSASVQVDGAAGSGDVSGAAASYLAALQRHLESTAKHQAEVAERITFLLDRLLTATQQEKQLKYLNLGTDAVQKQTKAKEQLRSSLQEAVTALMGCSTAAQSAMAAFQGHALLLQRTTPGPVYMQAMGQVEEAMRSVQSTHEDMMRRVSPHT